MKDTQYIPYTIGIVMFIFLTLKVNDMGLFDFMLNWRKPAPVESMQEQYDDAEIQLIDLIHLVESEKEEVFAELIAYTGSDEGRNFNTHLDLTSEAEGKKNQLYFNSLQKIIISCREAKPSTGNFETDFTFVIPASEKVVIDEREIIRVHLTYCTPEEEECLDTIWKFDFVMGEKEHLLIDIDEQGLYKS